MKLELGGDSRTYGIGGDKRFLYLDRRVEVREYSPKSIIFNNFEGLVGCNNPLHQKALELAPVEDSLELSTAETSAYNSYYLAWYADVTHEIKPVQTGYRWALTYNLIIDYEDSRLSASVLDSQIQSLVEALSPWETLQYPPDFLVYPLDHQYTLRNLRLPSLKGLDYQRARCLADSCDRHGEFYLFLAQLDKYNCWPNDEDGESNMTRRTYLHHVCSLEGFELSPLEVDIDRTSLLDSINYEREPDFRGGGEYMGNQHEDIEETYSDMVLVIVRADSLHAPLFNPSSPQDVNRVMTHLWAGINDNTKTTLQKILVRLCRIILDQGFADEAANDVYLGYAAVTAAFLGDWPLFEEAREKTLKAWDYGSWSALGGLIDLQDPPIEIDDIFKSLTKCGTFCGVYKGLTHLYNGFCGSHPSRKDPAKAEYGKQWYSDKLIKTLDMCDTSMGEKDAATIKEIVLDLKIQYTPEQRKKIDKAVTDFIDRFKEFKEFMNALNIELLLELSNPKNVRKEFLRDLFRVISEFAISTFDFELYYAYVKHLYYSNTDVLIRDFYNQTLAHDKDLASNLLRQLSTQAPNCREEYSSLEVQTCFQSLVGAYITKTVGEEPSKPEDWARPAEVYKCYSGCKACSELNPFLKDPKAKEITIALNADDQNHIKWHFDYLETGNGDREGEVRYTKTLKGWEKRRRNWVLDGEAAQKKLQELPKDALKQALGDKYDTLMGLDLVRIGKSTAQAPDKAQPPSRPKRKKGKDANNTAPGRTSKRARRGGEKIEG
ncbi:hypothetical protein F5883DRAFT_654985 [Diaporthe sp. PMI_573]|nr:hypothetical protein F5883DRAFT_654985 [Diaporthaceae sp. PMI_573]